MSLGRDFERDSLPDNVTLLHQYILGPSQAGHILQAEDGTL